MDIDKYLEDFNARLKQAKLKPQTKPIEDYGEFVRGLISSNKILSRQFFIVITASNVQASDFATAKEQLGINYEIVAKGLARMGIRASRLSSLEVLDLFYGFYNPVQAKLQPITEQTMNLLRGSYV